MMLDGHEGGASYEEPAGPISYYAQNLLAPVIMTFVLQIVFAIIFIFLEGWDFWSGLYHCFVTITTVGYGDTPLTTDGGATRNCPSNRSSSPHRSRTFGLR